MMASRKSWAGFLLLMLLFPGLRAAPPWRHYEKMPDSWYAGSEGSAIAQAILSWQSPVGSWPKNTDTAAKPFTGNPQALRGTFDNGATLSELRFLARAFRVTQRTNYYQAFIKGLDHLLQAQYSNGGWPQSYPPGASYSRHITFNDGTMVGIMRILREIATSSGYDFVDRGRGQAARAAFERGIDCILKCQIVVNGQLTVWCAQHDEVDFSARPARTYELASLSGAESAGILRLLMSLDEARPDVMGAIKAGARWFEAAKIQNVRQVVMDGDKVILPAPGAPPLWARFYEIESNRPFFCGRDGIKKYSLAEIESERRNGYAWLGNWGEAVAKDYAQWSKRWGNAEGESKALPGNSMSH